MEEKAIFPTITTTYDEFMQRQEEFFKVHGAYMEAATEGLVSVKAYAYIFEDSAIWCKSISLMTKEVQMEVDSIKITCPVRFKRIEYWSTEEQDHRVCYTPMAIE